MSIKMDFIPFNSSSSNRNKTSTPQNCKSSSQNHTPPSGLKKKSFSSPAMPAFGSPAVNFGAPAINNSSFSHFDSQNRTPSPGQYNKPYSPRSRGNNSPRGFNNSNHNYRFQHHSPYSQKDTYNQFGDNSRPSVDGSNFKAPHQFSNRGRGSGRKSFSKQFGQTPRYGSNYNTGGGLNIEDFYHPGMIEDPWCSLSPVLLKA